MVAALALASLGAGCGDGHREVEATAPRRGTIRETFSEPAKTRLRQEYLVSMPLEGRIGRIELEPGDAVTSGQLLVAFDRAPLEAEVGSQRAAVAEAENEIVVNEDDAMERIGLVNAQALIAATDESINASRAQVDAEQARQERAALELQRLEELAASGTIPESRLDDARLLDETSRIDLYEAKASLAADEAIAVAVKSGPLLIEQYLAHKRLQRDSLARKLEAARERLAKAEHALALAEVRSPIDGIVLERHTRGDGPLAAGTELLTLGVPDGLEVVAEVLTTDAMRLAPGARVDLGDGREKPVAGRVVLIEPKAFTKLSTLGVEQQRVRVIVEPEAPLPGVGVGFRVEARFEVGKSGEALLVPRFSVLESPEGAPYVFKIAGGRLKAAPVSIGLASDLEMEIVEGLAEADRIVAMPDALLHDGDRVKVVDNN